METIKSMANEMKEFLISFFGSDNDVMNRENDMIFSNDEDRNKYIDAVERLKNNEVKEVTIILSGNKIMKLVSE